MNNIIIKSIKEFIGILLSGHGFDVMWYAELRNVKSYKAVWIEINYSSLIEFENQQFVTFSVIVNFWKSHF